MIYVHLTLSGSLLLGMGNAVEKIKTHLLCLKMFFSEYRVVYEVMWKDFLEPKLPQRKIYRSTAQAL